MVVDAGRVVGRPVFVGAEQAGIDLDLRPHLGDVAKAVQEVADGDQAAGGDVVGEAGAAALEQQGVGAGHVADVGEIAPLVEIADAHPGRGAGGDRGQLGREGRGDEILGLAGADVVGRAGDHDVEAVVRGVEKRGVVGGGLGDAIDVVGPVGGVLGQRRRGRMGAIDLGGRHHEDPRGRPVLPNGVEDVQGADGVDVEDALRLGPAQGDEGDAAQVQDGVGSHFGQDGRDRIGIADVQRQIGGRPAGGTADVAADGRVAGRAQGGHGVPSDETRATGDEDFHFRGRIQNPEFSIQNGGRNPNGRSFLIF